MFGQARRIAAGVFSWTLLCGLAVSLGCRDTNPGMGPSDQQVKTISSASEALVVAFCGDCHKMPQASSFTKDAWRAEVLRGYGFYYASGRSDLEMPVQADAIEYFVSRAPERIELGDATPVDTAFLKRFEVQPIAVEGLENAAVSFVDVLQLDEPLGRCLVFSDMRDGGIYAARLQTGNPEPPLKIADLRHPATIRPYDWDQDGLMDLIVADLGAFLPSDTKLGGVVCLRQKPESPGEFEPKTLVENVGRVAAAEITDMNLDGKADLLVAEFGWHDTGSITWFEQTEGPWGPMRAHVIDNRPGVIHVPVVDLNGDGASDFVALVSQHFEQVEAFINDGQGNFQSELIFSAPDPSYGSSGIDLVDVNKDGLVDIVYTNGDSFDSFTLKPFHAVRWFENLGAGEFRERDLGAMPGAHRARAGDIDGDGRQDIVAGAFLPRDVMLASSQKSPEALVAWMQLSSGEFSKHVLESEQCLHASLVVEDLDGDGNAEIVVGNFRDGGIEPGPPIEIYRLKRP